MMSDRFFSIRNGIVTGYAGYDTEISVPAAAVKIGDNAFQNHPLIESVIIPEGVKQIGFYAFSGCRKLQKISIPESVKKIGKHAFDNCEALKEVTYHGVTFQTSDKIKTESVFRMIDTKDVSVLEELSSALKYQYLWSMFSANPEDKDIQAVIKKNFVKMFKYLIDENNLPTAEKVVRETKLVNKRNLESITKYADEKQNAGFQNLLKEAQEEK